VRTAESTPPGTSAEERGAAKVTSARAGRPTSRASGFGTTAKAPTTSDSAQADDTTTSTWSARPEDLKLTIAPVDPSRVPPMVDDGSGGQTPPRQPAQIDVEADRPWYVGAHDPVLRVGDRSFYTYSFPSPNVVRFVVADVSLVASNAEVSIGYGASHPIVMRKGARQ
jgi:hypothetical protein